MIEERSVHVAGNHWGHRHRPSPHGQRLIDHARTTEEVGDHHRIDGTNDGSIAFHARLGFREVGRLPGIGEKWGRPLDLVLMQLDPRAPH